MNSRRDFLYFMGRSGMVASLTGVTQGLAALAGCAHTSNPVQQHQSFLALAKSREDRLILAQGLQYQSLMSWGDPINKKGETFGFNNDFIGLIPMNKQGTEAYLWVNHEDAHPLFVSGHVVDSNFYAKTQEQVDKERAAVGGSLLHIKKSGTTWLHVLDSAVNRRVSGTTPISFSAGAEIAGKKFAAGTIQNCSGGVTPWGTFLSCEENYQYNYGDVLRRKGRKKSKPADWKTSWTDHYPEPPEHYGWVVEIDPNSFQLKKLVSLGRFSHEAATCITAKDGRCVVYMGDDIINQYFYKFISSSANSLDHGTLYVANFEKGQWLALDRNQNTLLAKRFKTQQEVLIYAREAAKILGATPMDRPEDCEIDPTTGAIYLCCTNNKAAGRPHGAIFKIAEAGGDYLSMNFKSEIFLPGGESTDFSCPDNIAFDRAGNLWMCTDVGENDSQVEPYEKFGNNSLFVIPMSGPHAGQALRVATAPVDAELTGPCFSPDGQTLFLSVQHPGARTKNLKECTSHWPLGGNHIPKPSVVMISGPLLAELAKAGQ